MLLASPASVGCTTDRRLRLAASMEDPLRPWALMRKEFGLTSDNVPRALDVSTLPSAARGDRALISEARTLSMALAAALDATSKASASSSDGWGVTTRQRVITITTSSVLKVQQTGTTSHLIGTIQRN